MCSCLVRQNNASENAFCFFVQTFSMTRFFLGRLPQKVCSCVVPLIGSYTTGAINLDSSKLNVIGNVSFEGNHADATGGKGKFEDAFPAIRGEV